MSDCCCEYAPRLRSIETRVEALRKTLVDAAGDIDGELIEKVLSGDFQSIVMMLASGSLLNLLELRTLIPDAEQIAIDYKEIVSEMEACCEDEEGPPEPEPEPDPEPVDWNEVRVVSRDAQDIGNWKATSVASVKVHPQKICIDHTMRGRWPEVPDVDGEGLPLVLEGNPWIIVEHEGQLWASTYEWLKAGQACKALGNGGLVGDRLGGHIKHDPLRDYRPKVGEKVYFCVSTLARDHRRTSDERSLVVEVIWPEGA